ncbi:helix-turn-helix transcriptional regulator [Lysobacter sp. cf310]|uniref:helix-turn-helix transcriptional regulator n=1 Tax=Lysobacter sp. cf310 TaxID=1761790 RepID=UPI0008EA4C86|nr:YafY family protein [Lysobacter sp. cf310]SFL11690.1 Predicted DNA-binding transcriptional regulator YafY, contains an HTH and WYL domains [Lysobacter sp. cf310]
MRASRLLSIQMLLETRGRMSAQALADALEVSVRTLYRDIDQLCAAGVPIYAERGRSGGFELMEGWKTTLTGLTASEAQAVFMTGLAGPASQLGLGHEVADAQLKLMAALPTHQRQDAQRMQARFHLDTLEWYRENDPTPHLATVASAVWEERQLAIDYLSWRGEARRRVHPLGLVLKAGAWYLVAAVDSKPRTYRISNILQARRLDARALRPRRFDLAAYWAASLRRFEQDLYRGNATVLATPAGLHELAKLSAAVARAIAVSPRQAQADGRLRVTIPIETVQHATGQLLPLAPQVVAIEPPALVAAIAQQLDEIGACYGLRHRRPGRPKT